MAPRVVGAEAPVTYTVVPFENAGGHEQLDWMRSGLPVALAEKLEEHPALRSVYEPAILQPLPAVATPSAFQALGAMQGARWVFAGSFRRTTDWQLELTLRVYETTGAKPEAKLVAEHHVKLPFENTFEVLDEALTVVLPELGVTTDAATWKRIRRPLTQDLYSFTLFSRGVVAMGGATGKQALDAAQKNLTRAVFIDPDFAEAHRMLGLVYQAQGKSTTALGRFRHALDLRPSYQLAMRSLVKAAHSEDRLDEGIELGRAALTMRPDDVALRFLVGDMLWKSGDVEGAHEALEKVVALEPDHLAARRLRVLVHASRGKGQALASELEQVLRLAPDDPTARLDLAAAYRALGRDDEAIATYENIVAGNPKQLQALKLLGDMQRETGKLDEAIAYYTRALEVNRNDPRPYFLLGAAYLQKGDEREAIRIYYRAQRFKKYQPDVYNNLGTIFLGQDRAHVALWYLKRAAQKAPLSPRIRYNHGLALSRTGKHDEAVLELAEAASLAPRDAEIQFAHGAELLRVGQVQAAQTAFATVLELAPEHAEARHNLDQIERLERRAEQGEVTKD